MASQHLSPDFRGPRKSGDRFQPDAAGSPGSPNVRGKYPRDKAGPPEFPVGREGRSGDAKTPATPPNKQIDRIGPRATSKANTLSNPLK